MIVISLPQRDIEKSCAKPSSLESTRKKQTIIQCTCSPTIVMAKITFKQQGKLPTFLASIS